MTEPKIFPIRIFRNVPMPTGHGRRLVIADIHGCADAFIKLLEKIALSPDDQLFILGDLINRGPESDKVLDVVLELMDHGHHVFVLRGNHEEMLMEMDQRRPEQLAELTRTQPKLLCLINKKGRVKKRFRKLMLAMPLYYLTDGFILVHAGFNMAHTDPFRDLRAMTWVRDFKLVEPINGRRVVHGHQPRPLVAILADAGSQAISMGIDNGCVLGLAQRHFGNLVCFDLDSGHITAQQNETVLVAEPK